MSSPSLALSLVLGLVAAGGHEPRPLIASPSLHLSGRAQPPRTDTPVARPNDNRTPAGRYQGDTLVLRLVAGRAAWHIHTERDPAFSVLAFAEEGQAPTIPGPLIRVRAGTPIRATVRNPLTDSLIVHGLGTRGDEMPDSLVVPPGATVEARFASGREGTYFYWGVTTATKQRSFNQRRGADAQLSAAFIIDPLGPVPPRADRVFVITQVLDTVRADGTMFRDSHGLPLREFVALNGKSWPDTERLTHAIGDSIRWRVMNASATPHPMHLHGFYFRVHARGLNGADTDTSYAPGERRMAVTELLMQGRTLSMSWVPDRPGGWLFHCHLTSHAVLHPPIDRRDIMDHPAEHQHGDPDRHAFTGMNGLVLGTTVVGRSNASTVWRPARRLRLFVHSDSAPNDKERRFGYVLQRGAAEPARDSLEPTGSLLLLTRGESTAIDVVNRSGEATAVHWHGMELESYYDGVVGFGGTSGRTTRAIRPGATFEVRMTPPRAGTFMYHTHFDELRQQYGGLVGALVVLERGARWDAERDRVFLISDGTHLRVYINGSLTPPPIDLRVGTTYRFRFANIAVDRPTLKVRLTHDSSRVGELQPLGGDLLAWRPVAKDGWTLTGAQTAPGRSLQPVGSGETADVEFTPDRPGEIMLQAFVSDTARRTMLILGAIRLRVFGTQ